MASTTGKTDQFSSVITVYGADWCIDCRHAKAWLTAAQAAFDYVDLGTDQAAAAKAEAISGQKHIPVVVFPDGVFYVEPTKVELLMKLEALKAQDEAAAVENQSPDIACVE
ncbi:MAG: NrdH-redoxin [Propionibacteriaceae bacterium]|jgi:glutaredoxin|nr:NrdH-redoxin [Propionibacteriaceae bacterium]